MTRIETRPAPDEFCRSHGGRLARLNSYRGLQSIETAASDSKRHARSSPTALLALLASASGASVDEYLHDHSCILFSDLDSFAAVAYRHSAITYGMLAGAALSNPRTDAYFCERCLADDLAIPIRPYWRRSHQVPGVAYCSEHLHPLRAVSSPQAFDFAPTELLGVDFQPEPDMLADSHRQRWAKQFSMVARRMLELPWQRAVIAIYEATSIAGDEGSSLDMVLDEQCADLRRWAETQDGWRVIRQAIAPRSSSGDVTSDFKHWPLLIPKVAPSECLLLTAALMALQEGKYALATADAAGTVAA